PRAASIAVGRSQLPLAGPERRRADFTAAVRRKRRQGECPILLHCTHSVNEPMNCPATHQRFAG
ncbi:MAG: hypothetical protein KDA61_09410, partial [Planctomycetales bacterium]|nr:hypothetical protein [Planctomycetales bacterium]